MIEKTEAMNLLLDMYENLLTEKQRDIMNLHYKEDLSLSEISEELSISRSAVADHLKRSSLILQEYEEKLKLVEKYETKKQIYAKIKELENNTLNELIEELESLD